MTELENQTESSPTETPMPEIKASTESSPTESTPTETSFERPTSESIFGNDGLIVNPISQLPEKPLPIPKKEIEEPAKAPTPVMTDDINKIIPKETILYRITKKPQYKLNAIKNSENVPGQWFYITTKFLESECLNQWQDFILQRYVTDEEIKIPKTYYFSDDNEIPINYAEIQKIEGETAKLFIKQENFKNIILTDIYTLPLALLCDIYGIKYRRFVCFPRGLALYSADYEVLEKPKIADGNLGVLLYTTRVPVEDQCLREWRDMVLNVYCLRNPLTLPYGRDLPRDPVFHEQYEDVVVDERTGEETLLSSYYDDRDIPLVYLHKEDTTGEVFLMEQDLENLAYYGSFEMKLDTLKFIHGIQRQIRN